MDKIKVYAKAQNRTALGIAAAYLKIRPKANLQELNQAFPISLNGRNRAKTIFVDVKDKNMFKPQKGDNKFEMFFFEKEDEVFHLKDGTTIAMQELWTEEDYRAIVKHSKQFGIVVAPDKEVHNVPRGTYRLEYLNGFDPNKKGFPIWALLLVLTVIIVIVVFLFI